MNKKELEKLSKSQLIKVAEHLSMYGLENMTKDELINKISIIGGIETKAKTKEIKLKTTFNTKLYHIFFISLILINLTTTIDNLITSLYWGRELNLFFSRPSTYYVILTIASFIFNVYIYWLWIRHRILHFWIIISTLLSLGWFIYSQINSYDIIKAYNLYEKQLEDTNMSWEELDTIGLQLSSDYVPIVPFINTLKTYVYYFWITTGLISLFTITSATCLLIIWLRK